MTTVRRALALGAGVLTLSTISCTSSDGSGSGSSTNASVAGKLASTAVVSSVGRSNSDGRVGTLATKTITHVMAVSPATGNPERYVAAVAADGSFSLGLNSGKPYIIVFVAQDGTLTGSDMIAGIVKVSSNDLDTLPIAQAASVALGDVTVNGTTGEASMSTSVTDLLSTLGVSASDAAYIGNVDDLALRLSNPDVDGNGVIDASEGKSFSMDWHVRANTEISGTMMKMNDIENAFAAAADVSLVWTLSSAYAVYLQSYDNVNYIVNSGGSTALTNGGAFSATGTAVAATSMSGGTFSSYRQWGPDYNMGTGEMGGSDAAAVFEYTLGSTSKKLTFSHVRTKLKSELNADGVMLPFIKLNTTGGKLTGISYKWMKRSGSAWVDASAAEVGVLVQGSGAYLRLNTVKNSSTSTGLNFTIPATSASGTINIGGAGYENDGVSDPTNKVLNDFCSAAMSYDDKMGLRIFAGAPAANDGVTACN